MGEFLCLLVKMVVSPLSLLATNFAFKMTSLGDATAIYASNTLIIAIAGLCLGRGGSGGSGGGGSAIEGGSGGAGGGGGESKIGKGSGKCGRRRRRRRSAKSGAVKLIFAG